MPMVMRLETSIKRVSSPFLRPFLPVAPLPCVPEIGQIYTRASMDTDPPTYCTMFHHMVKNGGTAIRDQLVMASESQGRDTPGMSA